MLHFDQGSLNSFTSPCALLLLQKHQTDQSAVLGVMLYLTLPAGSLLKQAATWGACSCVLGIVQARYSGIYHAVCLVSLDTGYTCESHLHTYPVQSLEHSCSTVSLETPTRVL